MTFVLGRCAAFTDTSTLIQGKATPVRDLLRVLTVTLRCATAVPYCSPYQSCMVLFSSPALCPTFRQQHRGCVIFFHLHR